MEGGEVSHTTGVIKFMLLDFTLDETKCEMFKLTDRVVDIHSKYMHIGTLLKKQKKRKPTIYRKKRDGDLGAFDSQIQISILAVPSDTHYHSRNGKAKIYKFKVFRNGSGVCPGVLDHDLSDVYEPLAALCQYLSDIYGRSVTYDHLCRVTHNYKLRAPFLVNIRKLLSVLELERTNIYLISLTMLDNLIIRPTNPLCPENWGLILQDDAEISIDLERLLDFLTTQRIMIEKKIEMTSYRYVRISHDDLLTLVKSPELHKLIKNTLNSLKAISVFGHSFSDEEIENLIRVYVSDYIRNYVEKLGEPKSIDYYINDRMVRATVKYHEASIVFYTSGKINIHGIPSESQLSEVVDWLQMILRQYQQRYQPINSGINLSNSGINLGIEG